MADRSNISWTDATWNVVTGCTKVSAGCEKCYAETFAERWRGIPGHYFTNGFDLTLRPERLNLPFSWRKPRKVFVNSMSDLFHEKIPDSFIAETFAVMAKTPQHTYQILTKRHGRMRSLLNRASFRDNLAAWGQPWPLPNVWAGVSVENQHWADIRVPALLETPAAVRFLSCEPLLGPVDLTDCDGVNALDRDWISQMGAPHPFLDWVIVGGESGHGHRPVNVDWLTSIVDACRKADAPVPVWTKQDSGHKPGKQGRIPDGYWIHQFPA